MLEEIKNWQHIVYLQEEKIEFIKNEINEIHSFINNLSGLKEKVEYMKNIEGKRLKEIAIELGYSYQYIRKISAKKCNI